MKSFLIVVLIMILMTAHADFSINLSASKNLPPLLPINLPEFLQKTTKNALNFMGNYGSSPGTGNYGSSPTTGIRNTGGSSYVSYDQKGSSFGSNAGFQPFKMLGNIFNKFRIPGLDKFVNALSPSAQYGTPRPPINQYLPPAPTVPIFQQYLPPPSKYGVPNNQYNPPSSNTPFNPLQPPNNSNPPPINTPSNPPIFPPSGGFPNNNYGLPPVDNQYLPPSNDFSNNWFPPSNNPSTSSFPASNNFSIPITDSGINNGFTPSTNNGNGFTVNNPTTTGDLSGNFGLNSIFRQNGDPANQIFGTFNEDQFSNGFVDQQHNDINGQNGNQFSSSFGSDTPNQNTAEEEFSVNQNNNIIPNFNVNHDQFGNNKPDSVVGPTLTQSSPPWVDAQNEINKQNVFNGHNSLSNRNSVTNAFKSPQWNQKPQWVGGVHNGNSIQGQEGQSSGGFQNGRNEPRKVTENTIWDKNMLKIFRQAGGNQVVNPDLNSNVGQVPMGNYSINFCNRSCGEFTPLPGRSPTTLKPINNRTISVNNETVFSNIVPINITQPRALNLAQADDRIGSEEVNEINTTLENRTEAGNSFKEIPSKEKHSNIPSIRTAQVLTHLSSFPTFLDGGLGSLKYAPLAQSSKMEIKLEKADNHHPENVSETISELNITITANANPSINRSLSSNHTLSTNQTITTSEINETISEWTTEIEEIIIEKPRNKRSTNKFHKFPTKSSQKKKLLLTDNSNSHLKKFAKQLMVISKAKHPLISSRKLLATTNSEDSNLTRLETTAPKFTRMLHPNISNSLNLAKISAVKNYQKTLSTNPDGKRVSFYNPTVNPLKTPFIKQYIGNGQQKIIIKKQRSKITQPSKKNDVTQAPHVHASANTQELSKSPPQQLSDSTASTLDQHIRIIRPSDDHNIEVLPNEQILETSYQPQQQITSESQQTTHAINSIAQNDFSNTPALEIVYQPPQNPHLATNANSNIQNIRENQQKETSSEKNLMNAFQRTGQFVDPDYQHPKTENTHATTFSQPLFQPYFQNKNYAYSDSNIQKHSSNAHFSPPEHGSISEGQNSPPIAQPTSSYLYHQASFPSHDTVNYHLDPAFVASEQSSVHPSQINIAYTNPQNGNHNFLGVRPHQQPQFIYNPNYVSNGQASYSNSLNSRIDAPNNLKHPLGGSDGYLYHRNFPLHNQVNAYQLTHPAQQPNQYHQMTDVNIRYDNNYYEPSPTEDVHNFANENSQKMNNRKVRTSKPEHFQSFSRNDQWDAEPPEIMATASDFQSSVVVNPPSNDRNSLYGNKKDSQMKKTTTRYRHFPVSESPDNKENSRPDLKKDLLSMMHNLTKLMIETHDSDGKRRDKNDSQVKKEKKELEYDDEHLYEDDYILDTDSTEKRHINKWNFPKSPIHAALIADDSSQNNEKQRMSGVLRIKSIKRTKNSQRDSPRNFEQEEAKGSKKDDSTESLLRSLIETLTNLQEKKETESNKRGKESINMVVSTHETKISDSMTTEEILELLANKVLDESDDNLENTSFLQVLDKILDTNGPFEGDINLNENVSLSKVTFLNELKNNLGKNQSNIPLHMQILKLPINKSNMLKLIIEAQVLNETSSVDSHGENTISERLIRNPFQALSENTSSEEINVTSSSNFGETTNPNSSTSHNSGVCHMCINIFQGSQSISSLANNFTNESGNNGLPYQSPMSTSYQAQNNDKKDTYSAGISITQLNYGDGSRYPKGNYSDNTLKEGWSPTSLHWVQGMNAPQQQPNVNNQLGATYFKRNVVNNHDPIAENGGYGRDGVLPVGRDVILPVVREGDIQNINPQYKLYGGSGGYVRFPRNKPFGGFRDRPESERTASRSHYFSAEPY